MKKSFLSVLLIVVFLLAFVGVTVAFAQGETPPAPPAPPTTLEVIWSSCVQLATLVGFGAAITAIVNILKSAKVVTDGNSGKWVAGLNLIAIGVLIYLKLFQPQLAVEYVDAQAAVFANILVALSGYVFELGSSLFAHGLFADLRLPWIGKSFSRERQIAG